MNYNPENANEPNLSASSPIQPPDIDNYDPRSGHIDHRPFIDRFDDNNESHIPYKREDDRKSDMDSRLDLSPITDQPSRKRRKVSSCDTPSLPLQTSLSRHPSESQVSSLVPPPPLFRLSSYQSISLRRWLNRWKEISNIRYTSMP